jgi:hypothetical protein
LNSFLFQLKSIEVDRSGASCLLALVLVLGTSTSPSISASTSTSAGTSPSIISASTSHFC